jgi:methylmalonyl-CoA mutase
MSVEQLAELHKRAAEMRRNPTESEKRQQIEYVNAFHARHAAEAPAALERLQHAARSGANVFAELLETVKVCSLGQISNALYAVGGRYRRNM